MGKLRHEPRSLMSNISSFSVSKNELVGHSNASEERKVTKKRKLGEAFYISSVFEHSMAFYNRAIQDRKSVV